MTGPTHRRRLAFETRLLLLCLAGGLPAVVLVALLLHLKSLDGALVALTLAVTVGCWLSFDAAGLALVSLAWLLLC